MSRPVCNSPTNWYWPSFLTTWNTTGNALLFGIDVPEGMQQANLRSLEHAKVQGLQAHPLAFHSPVLDHIISDYDNAIWRLRDFIRLTEKTRPTIEKPGPNYVGKQELARHVMHCTEVSSTALTVIDTLLEEVAIYEHRSLSSDTPGVQRGFRILSQ